MTKTHDLKIELKYYNAVKDKIKTFEIRKNDRGFRVGDAVFLYPVDDDGEKINHLNPIKAEIGYMTDYEQKDGYVVFSLEGLDDPYVKAFEGKLKRDQEELIEFSQRLGYTK